MSSFVLWSPRQRFRELRDAHNKAMEDMATEVEAKEQVHAQEINNLERKLLIDKGNMQKVRQGETNVCWTDDLYDLFQLQFMI